MTIPLTHLGPLSIQQFLAEYWQKKPLLIRQALPGFISPLSPEEIAGLALEEEVESRLVIETPHLDPLNSAWQLEHGPLDEQRFASVPSSHWTVLVQAVDQMFPQVQALLNQFRFIPNWRLDDVMVSYAATGGSVGPHFDYYDVFLLQGQGRRLWRVGGVVSEASPLREDTEMKILQEFDTQEEWVLEPGDMLYLPPNVAHWGVSQSDDCVTYSIGFRAPSHSELLLGFSHFVAEELSSDERFSDPNMPLQQDPGEIQPWVLDKLKQQLQALVQDEVRLTEWFGRFATEVKREAPPSVEPPVGICLQAGCRAAYIMQGELALLFVNGEMAECSQVLAKAICSYQPIQPERFSEEDQELIVQMQEAGWIYDPEDN
ncbi:MAG: hypothetical protein RL497_777 [Pseudomonadota bacterium]